MFVMATFLEPPPLASIAAVIGFAALSFAIGLSGGSREIDADHVGSTDVASGENPSPMGSDDATPTEGGATEGPDAGPSGGHE